jgi:hypothetical protein
MPVDYVVEIFEGFSDSELRRLFMEHYKHGFGFLPQEAFAGLDERGAQDKTVVIHLWDEDIDDEALRPGVPGESDLSTPKRRSMG